MIGFAFPTYPVREDAGTVTIAVQLMSIVNPDSLGNLDMPIIARVSTVDNANSASPPSNCFKTIILISFMILISPLINIQVTTHHKSMQL